MTITIILIYLFSSISFYLGANIGTVLDKRQVLPTLKVLDLICMALFWPIVCLVYAAFSPIADQLDD